MAMQSPADTLRYQAGMTPRNANRATRLGLALLLCSACSSHSQAGRAQAPGWPGAQWPSTTPAAVGLEVAVLDSIDAEIRSGRYGHVDRLLVIRNGMIAFDRRYVNDYDEIYGDSARTGLLLRSHDRSGPYNYFNAWWHPYYRRGDLHSLQSVTKTVTSLVIGAATTRGEFPSLNTPVLSFFEQDSVLRVDDRKRSMTIRHLLTMTAGIGWDESLPYAHPMNTTVRMERLYDWVMFAINQPMSEEPGTRFNYNSGASQILSHIFHRATGLDMEEYAARHLFGPVGIRDWYWKRTPAGRVDTEGGLYLAAEDLARLWYLVLRGGIWEGNQVLSADWVRRSVEPAVHVRDGTVRYGLKWWLYPNPTDSTRVLWAGSGFGGQYPIAVPEDDLIVVIYAWNILPGRPGMPREQTMLRILNGVTNRSR
jgi:CubicO group peptidase (beta-lactamase class C family)